MGGDQGSLSSRRAWGLHIPTCKQEELTRELVATLVSFWPRMRSDDRSPSELADERRGHIGEALRGLDKIWGPIAHPLGDLYSSCLQSRPFFLVCLQSGWLKHLLRR